MSDEEIKKLILARRAAFIAAAVAGIAVTNCDPKPGYPNVCLSQPYDPSMNHPVDDPDASATTPDAGEPVAPPPRVCLSPLPASKP